MSDFIDRAKLEALAETHVPILGEDEEELTYSRKKHRELRRSSFLAGAAAYAALLDAETTEEWGVRHISVDGWPSDLAHTSKEAAERDLGTCGWNCHLISRRVAVTPWLPSEGGEKRG